MSDSVVPTPSDAPTCKHGAYEGHDDIIYTPGGQRLIYCSGPGPVIATPEKCKIEKDSGFCDPHKSYECPVIATEPDTPGFGETCENCHEPIYRDGVYRHCDDDKVDCTLMAEPASDPTPDLRETIEVTDEDALRILRGYWRDVAASFCDSEIQNMVELLEAFVARKLKAETP